MRSSVWLGAGYIEQIRPSIGLLNVHCCSGYAVSTDNLLRLSISTWMAPSSTGSKFAALQLKHEVLTCCCHGLAAGGGAQPAYTCIGVACICVCLTRHQGQCLSVSMSLLCCFCTPDCLSNQVQHALPGLAHGHARHVRRSSAVLPSTVLPIWAAMSMHIWSNDSKASGHILPRVDKGCMQALTCWYAEQLEARAHAATPGKGRGRTAAAADSLASPLGKLGLKSPAAQQRRRGAASPSTLPLGKMQLTSPVASEAPRQRTRQGRGARMLFKAQDGPGDAALVCLLPAPDDGIAQLLTPKFLRMRRHV